MNRVVDAPVARRDDPVTSYVAGENRHARVDGRTVVLAVLRDVGEPLTDSGIYDHYLLRFAGLTKTPLTPQRIRTARAYLVDEGVVVDAGVVAGGSPTGRGAHAWAVNA